MPSSSSSPHSLLTSGLDQMQISLPDPVIKQLATYFTELKKWSKKINLVSQASDQQIIETHFLDSLTLLPIIQQISATSILDVGSGAGFPGLVLKIALPHLPVTLLEPRQKRVSFLKHVCRTTKIKDVNILSQRLKTNDPSDTTSVGQFSIITCRALTTISEFLQMVENLSPKGGYVICMKGPQAELDVSEWQKDKTPKFILKESRQFALPFSNASRVLVVFQKK